MQKSLFIINFSLFILVAFIASGCQEPLQERCERECKEFTQKKCPMPVAADITVDSLTFDKKKLMMTYHYTLTGMLDDAEVLRANDLRTPLLQALRNSTQDKLYKDAGYSFRYIYYSAKEKGTQLFSATFRKNDYQ